MNRRYYPNIEAFYGENEVRRLSGEVDYGVWWREDDRDWPVSRVSWVVETGEFYAIRSGRARGLPKGEVELLGVVRTRTKADEVMNGWELQEIMRLSWARQRLESHPPPRETTRTRGPEVADSLEIDFEEDGAHLLVTTDQGNYNFRIQGVAFQFAESTGLRGLLEWAGEGHSVRAEVLASRGLSYDCAHEYHDHCTGGLCSCECHALSVTDPKNPRHAEVLAEAADQRRKEVRES